jgi:hypothetical protein
LAVIAAVIGVRANATEIAVPRVIRSVRVAASVIITAGSCWVSDAHTAS